MVSKNVTSITDRKKILYSITQSIPRISSLHQGSFNKYDNVKQKFSAGDRGTEMFDRLKTTPYPPPYPRRIKITRVVRGEKLTITFSFFGS